MLPRAILIAVCIFMCVTFCEMYSFRVEPLRTMIKDGQDVMLLCEISNIIDDDEEYILAWEKNGVVISKEHTILGPTLKPGHRFEADLIPITDGFMYVLKINPVKSIDAGKYTCLAQERMKQQTRSPQQAVLIVNEIPSLQYPKSLTEVDGAYREGEEVTLTCVSEIVTPPVTLQWVRDGDKVSATTERDDKNGLVKTRHTFTPTHENNGNKFVCNMTSSAMASSGMAIKQCRVSPLVVLHKPIVRIRRYSVVYAGKESVFICESIANPRMTTYEWTFSSQLSEKIIIDKTHQILRLKDPSMADHGCKITCLATNKMGTSSTSVTINVQKSPDEIESSDNNFVDPDGLYDYRNADGDFLGVPLPVAILGLSGVVIFLLFLTVTPVCYCCLCGKSPRLFTSKDNAIAQLDNYSIPKDTLTHSHQVPMLDDLAPWMKSIASQIPEDLDVHYSEIGGDPLSLTFPKCSCV